jgi:hypothetical protein
MFTADAHWRFPRGDATGVKEIIERRDGTLGLWKQTLHSVSSVLIQLIGDRASFTATLLATHIHRDDDPGAPLQIGGRLTGEAARSDAAHDTRQPRGIRSSPKLKHTSAIVRRQRSRQSGRSPARAPRLRGSRLRRRCLSITQVLR